MRLDDMTLFEQEKRRATENSINSSTIDLEAEKTKNTTKKNLARDSSHYMMNDPVLTNNVNLAEQKKKTEA